MENQNVKGFSIGDYVCPGGKGSLIGKGSFADVFLGYHKVLQHKVAIKVVDVARLTKGSEKLKEHLASEIQIMKSMDHENIVKLFDVFRVCARAHAHPLALQLPHSSIIQ